MTGGSATQVGNSIYLADGGGTLQVLVFKQNIAKARIMKRLSVRLIGRYDWHLAQLAHDKIYFFSRYALVEYDTVLGTVAEVDTTGESPLGREFMSSVFASWRNEIITFGGFYVKSIHRSNETHAFNVFSNTWKKIALRGKPPAPRTVHAATVLGTKMYIFGGCCQGNSFKNDLWIAELGSTTTACWSNPVVRGCLPSSRTQSALNHFNGLLILFGGYGVDRLSLGDAHLYVLAEEMWHERAASSLVNIDRPPFAAKGHLGVTTSQGVLYVTNYGIFLLSQE